MPDYSMKAKRRAWQRAKEAADAVEAAALGKKGEDAAGGAARQERLLLDRLRDENHARSVGEAWLRIERHFKNGDESQQVIRGLLDAVTLSKNIALMPVDYRRSMKHLKELKGFADQLYVYFTDGIARDPLWMIIASSRLSNERNFRDMVVSLERIRLFLAGREEQFSHIFGQMGLTREIKAPVAQRVVFTAALSNAMHNIFGEWLASCANACTLIATSTIARKVNVTIVRPLMGILGLPLTLCVAAHGCTLIKAYAIAPAASPCWPQSGVPHVW